MAGLKQSGAFDIEEKTLAEIRALFAAGKTDQAGAAAEIARSLKDTGVLIDPHTAVAVAVARKHERRENPMVVLSTAHPAKFPDAVKSASGIDPALPAWLAGLMDKEERFSVLSPDLDAIEAYIRSGIPKG